MSIKGILVLEGPWSEEVDDQDSVQPFIEGWADVRDIPYCYRMYYDSATLARGLRTFFADKSLQVCYIAVLGSHGRLCGFV